MVEHQEILSEERKRIENAAERETCLLQPHGSNPGSRIHVHPNEYASSISTNSKSRADAPVARIGEYSKLSGMTPHWATPSARTISPDTSAPTSTSSSAQKSPTIAQRQPLRSTPSELARPRQVTPRLPTSPAEMALVWESKKQFLRVLPLVPNQPVIKKSSIGSSVPVIPPVTSIHQQKTIGTGTRSRKTDAVGDDFEVVEHGDFDEEFDILSSEGPSALNGTCQPDQEDILDDLEGAFRSLGKSVLDWKNGH